MYVCGRDALYDSRHAAESTDGCTWFILFYLFFDFKKEDEEELLNRERKFILNFYSPVGERIKKKMNLTTKAGGHMLPNCGRGQRRRHKRKCELLRRSGRRPSWPRTHTLEQVQCLAHPVEHT